MALKLMQIRGNLNVRASWKGLRGQYHDILNTDVTATPGSILTPTPEFFPMTNDTVSMNFRKQTRTIISENVRGELEGCDAVGVESDKTDSIDCAFGLILRFRGVGGLLAYRIATDAQADNTEGSVPESESGLKILPEPAGVCPESISGATPTYTAVDDIAAEAFTPIEPTFIDEDYTAPVA